MLRVDSGAAGSMRLESPDQRLGQRSFARKPGLRMRPALLSTGMLASMAWSWGCSGAVSGNSPTPPLPQTYDISGTISPAVGGSGATLTLSGAASAATTADSSGSYTFTGLANGTYAIIPSHTGYTFSPTSQSVTVSGANVTAINFTDTPQSATYSISGTISPAAGGSGATLTLSGAASAATTADSSGSYTFTGLANGTYAIIPSHTGYTFSPTSQSVTVSGANVTAINFTDTPQSATYSISGTISPTAGGSGATVILSGAAGATTLTNASGSYSFSALTNGLYTVTPSNTGYMFSPPSMNVTINAGNVPGVNFTATVQSAHSVALSWIASTSTVAGYNVYRSTVSGTQYTKVNPSLVVGSLAYTDTTVLGGMIYYYVTTAVDASGNESVHSNEVSANIP